MSPFKSYVATIFSVIWSNARKFALISLLALLAYRIETIHQNTLYTVDKARRDYLKDTHFYYLKGCYGGQLYQLDDSRNLTDYCEDQWNELADTRFYDFNKFGRALRCIDKDTDTPDM